MIRPADRSKKGIRMMSQPDRLRHHTSLAALAALSLVTGSVAASAQNAPPQGYDPNRPAPYGNNGDQPPPPGYDQNQQGYNQSQQGYDQNAQGYDQGQQGYNQNPPPGYDPSRPPPPEPAPPQGYAPGQTPPPPPGYAPPPDYRAQAEIDARYAADAQRWATQFCVKSHGDVAAGAVIGGVLGAIIGGASGGRHSGDSAAFGAILGAGTGAAVASSENNATSPGCPPGYVVRNGAPPYPYRYNGYVYAAPGWYRPWVFEGGVWIYRPYPYHTWYYRTYRGPYRGYYRGYRGGPEWHRP
jgi:hypothetical protein